MRGRRGRSGARPKSKERNRSNSNGRKNTELQNQTPQPRTKQFMRKNSTDYSSRESSVNIMDGNESADEIAPGTCDFPDYCLDCGVHAKRYQKTSENPLANLRTLYSHFPKDNLRLLLAHFLVTILLYILIFPVVNCLWTYLINVDDEIMNLFTFIAENPGINIADHIKELKWLTLPGINAESCSLLLSTILKDALTIYWEGFIQDLSIKKLIVEKIAKRYVRSSS